MAISPEPETTVKSSATDFETFAEELRRLKLNDLPLIHEPMLKDIVKQLLSDIRGDLPEPMQFHARFCAFLIEDALREARNTVNRSFILNVIWAGLNLAMTATPSAISDNWKHERPECPGHRTLTKLVSKLRKKGELPQRGGSFPKRSG
jgi:hypothetical protein